jgi:hypothetical protein
VRHSEFWVLMERHLGSGYARVWADTQVMSALGGKTATEALAEGAAPKDVWRAVHAVRNLPASAY